MPIYRDRYESFTIDHASRELAMARAIVFDEKEIMGKYRGRVPNDVLFRSTRFSGRPILKFVEPPLSPISLGDTANRMRLRRWRDGKVRGRIITQKDVERCKEIVECNAALEAEERERQSAILRAATAIEIAEWRLQKLIDAEIAARTTGAQENQKLTTEEALDLLVKAAHSQEVSQEATADDIANAFVAANGADWWKSL